MVAEVRIKRPGDSPQRLADVLLAAAVRSSADALYIEPVENNAYLVTFQRGQHTLATATVDAALGAASVARLAYLAKLDLAATHATSAVVPVRSGDRHADVVITIRPGDGPRADLMVMRRAEVDRVLAQHPVGVDAGDTIGNYRIIELLGEGGMGTVFRAEHVVLGRHYALKVLRPKVIRRDAAAAERFVREARAAARVRHPNIVDVFDVGHLADGRPFFVMELLEGESLADRVHRGPLVVGDVVAVARQIALALAAVHDRGVIHADITPSNVFVVSAEPIGVKLVDFGLAVMAGESLQEAAPNFVLGTPAYISPEQLRGLAATDRSDQYSFGVVLFELLAGHAPYIDADVRELCMLHLHAAIPAVTSPYGPLPPKLVDLVTTCLQKSPQARFPGMRALLGALDEIERVTDRRGWRRWLGT